ncbi:MAG: adenylate/guanylate cyclase domain-containing protein [Hyphomonadaceae bacterium]|jgi:adenylate cyclase|nr:adenylate/guanylate cyclase domain-containing protein [Hyphomonadaceae bacterium]
MRVPRIAPRFASARTARARAWLERLVDYGTQGYPPEVATRLKILNVVAYLIAAFTLFYAILQLLTDARLLAPAIALNLLVVVVALLVPFMHRISDIAGALMIALTEFAVLFLLTALFGTASGIHLQYFAGPATFFVIFGWRRLTLILVLTVAAFVLQLAAAMMFPREAARIVVDQRMLNDLYITATFTTFTMIGAVVYYAFRLADQAKAETEALLRNILPGSIVDRLKAAPDVAIADACEEASVLFADIKGFVSLAKSLGPQRTVALLNELMQTFDRLATEHGVEKVKTIGDAYMAVAGVPQPAPDHALRTARMSLAMLRATDEVARASGLTLALRIGIASGPVMAGVIGTTRLSYDVWGDTVNLAARLEHQSVAGRVLVSRETRKRLTGLFELEARGAVDIRGLGAEETWYLVAPLPVSSRPRAPEPADAAAGADQPGHPLNRLAAQQLRDLAGEARGLGYEKLLQGRKPVD